MDPEVHVVEVRAAQADGAGMRPKLAGEVVQGHRPAGDSEQQPFPLDERFPEPLPQMGGGLGRRFGLDLEHVLAEGGDELIRAALSNQAPAAHEGDPVAARGLFQMVGGQEQGRALLAAQAAEVLPDRAAVLHVEPDGGLIQQQDGGPVQDAAGDVEGAPHPARERSGARVARVREPEELEEGRGALAHGAGAMATQGPREAQVLHRGQVAVQGRFLEHHPDVPPHRERRAEDVVARDPGAPGARAQEGAQELEGGGLPRAVAAQQREELPRLDGEVESRERRDRAIALREALREDGRGRAHVPGARTMGWRNEKGTSRSPVRNGMSIPVIEMAASGCRRTGSTTRLLREHENA